MKRIFLAFICIFAISSVFAATPSDRRARKAIEEGNKSYRTKNYQGALNSYNAALKDDPQNITALFNRALALTQIADALPADKEKEKAEMLEQAGQQFEDVAKHVSDSPELAARANYNRGNISFNAQQYQDAIESYKQALRLNPADNNARRNLRIAQQRLPKQQDNNKNQNKDDKDKNKDNKDKDKKQDSNKDKDKNKNNQNKDNKDQQTPPKQQSGMSNQTADRILKRSADKENQTRKQAMFGNQGRQRSKRW